MSLIGNLDELGLGEILQLISLSRKTGVLCLHSREREGSITFKQGLVINAVSSLSRMNLGEELIQKGVIGQDILRAALALQKERGGGERLGELLVTRFAIARGTIEDVVSEQIEQVVVSFFAWHEGTFQFDALDEVGITSGDVAGPVQYLLAKGLNPQYLAMQGSLATRESPVMAQTGQVGGESTRAEAQTACSHRGAVDTPASAAAEAVVRPLVIVDDDGTTLQALAGMLRECGYEIHAMTSSEDTLIKIDSLYRAGRYPVVLVDLIMPRMDGSGVLGGMELLELLHNNFPGISILMMTDYHHSDAEEKAAGMGYRCIVKPHRVDCSSDENLREFLPSFLTELRRLEADSAARG